VRVAEYRVRLVQQFRAFLIAAEIGVAAHFPHEGSVGLLDHLRGRVGMDLEDLVIIDLSTKSHRKFIVAPREVVPEEHRRFLRTLHTS
jgi:hypothetical protein